MNESAALTKIPTYQAPVVYVTVFYMLLITWTLISVPLIASKASGLNPALLLMIGFFIAYTWYFSLGICYRVKIEDDGNVELRSYRRTIRIHPRKIEAVEGPPFPIWLGFIRFRFEGKKTYLFFFRKNTSLQAVFSFIYTLNPEIRFRRYGKIFG